MPGAVRVFVDTNVLLYSVDPRHAAKRAKAREWMTHLWSTGSGRLSWQVLHEFYANAERKIGTAPAAARKHVILLSNWEPCDVSVDLIRRGWHWMDKAGVTYWDALILAAAESLECSLLLSEDFQSGRLYGSVTVVNPFERDAAELGII